MSVKVTNQNQWLNYHHLHYFYTIVKEGSISKAAEKLQIRQPTLSAQLKQLEESLGKPLFERAKQRLHLTEAGKIVYDYATQIFELGSEMIEVLGDRLQTARVHLQIGALDSVPKQILSDLMLKAYKTKPCTISTLEGSMDQIMRELSAHQVDLVIANYAPTGDFQSVHAKSIGKLDVVVCAAPKFKHLKKGFPKSLTGQPFVVPTKHSSLRRELDHYFSVNQIRVDYVAETQDTSLQKILGAEEIGLIPIAEIAAKDLIKEKKLIVLGKLKSVYEQLWLITAKRKVENPLAASLIRDFTLE